MQKEKLLIIEDDYYQGLWYEEELEDEGYSVRVARSGNEALSLFENEGFGLVVLDIALPDINGLDLLPKILEKDKKIPVIINTAYPSYKDNFMSWAGNAYVIKSHDLSQLKEKIDEFMLYTFAHVLCGKYTLYIKPQ